MGLNLNVPETPQQLSPRITVIGVGGAGGNAVNNMIQSNLEGVEFVIMNTDAQALSGSICERKLQLGRNITQGLGAGSRPDIGKAAAEEAMDEILSQIEDANMVFITAGMGGGTGTGAAPVIARAAREAGLLTVGVITKPFHFEGVHRMRLAETGITELQQYVDTLIVIPNQNLFRVANEKTTFADAFKMADDVLYSGVRGVTDLMVMPGLINLDFADIRAVMTEMGKAMMGTGEAEGENRSIAAAEAAISNPLLDEVSMKGARGVLINITGGPDLTLFEVDEAANRIRDEVDPEANIIFGSTFDNELEGRMRVSVVATGIDVDEAIQPRPVTLSLVSSQAKEKAAQRPAAEAGSGAQAARAESVEAGDEEPSDEEREESVETAAFEAPRPAAPSAPQGGPGGGGAVGERRVAAAGGMGGGLRGGAATAQARVLEEEFDYEEEHQPQTGDAFIAPKPVEPENRYAEATRGQQAQTAPVARGVQAGAQGATRGADPFAEAAMANGSRAGEGEVRRPRSFLARMTDAARRIQAGEARIDEPHPEVRTGEPQAGGGRSEPSVAKAPAAEAPAQAPAAQAPAQAEPAPARPQAAAAAGNPAPRPEAGRPERQEPRMSAPQPQAQPQPRREAPSQPSLSGLEPGGQQAASSQEDDLLDIPAFLRRQAN